MKTSKLDYKLPPELIVSHPASPRESAKLLVIDRKKKKIKESQFSDIGDFLFPGDLLVFNRSKVFAARAYAKNSTGKKLEIFFLRNENKYQWEVLIGGRVKEGEIVDFGDSLQGVVQKDFPMTLKVNKTKTEVYEYLDKYGEVPLPPYIKREATEKDKHDYQNVFANMLGSAAAPTAGLHFTDELIKNLKKMGVEVAFVTLHVGLGTFAPIKSEKVESHQIHREYYSIDKQTKTKIKKAKATQRRVIACGTTALRVLETINDSKEAESGFTQIYIYPGYKFKVVDGLITNFHTPRSSLLALAWAFGGERLMKRAYKLAIKKKYRFFSYGDGMIII